MPIFAIDIEKDGQPIPYASIFTETGDIIGTTDLDGVLKDVKGAEVVSITHVAYKSKKITIVRACSTIPMTRRPRKSLPMKIISQSATMVSSRLRSTLS